MELQWSPEAWDEYLSWRTEDRKTLKRINACVKSIQRDGKPIGKSELLKGSRHGLRSVRIDARNRLVYKIDEHVVRIVSCRGRYDG